MLKWNYKSEKICSNGYEDVISKLKLYTKDMYINASQKDKENMVDDIFHIYREKNIFPIIYYNNEGVYKEIEKCINKDVSIKDNVLSMKNTYGSSLCKFIFPNIQQINVRNNKNNNMYDRFYDDHKLKRAITFCLKFKKSVTPSELRNGLEMIEHGTPLNFLPMRAKSLYERYCPQGGVIYDYACGFGGRMLGALSSKNDYTYIGVEPCIETYTHLNELGLYIEHVTNRNDSYKLFCMGSEDFIYGENIIDFSFSSPPYFNLEKYSDEPTQCYNKFSEIEKWFEGYVKPTIENTYKMLKPNSYYAVNIADFKINGKEIKYVDKWIEFAKNIGFEFCEVITLQLKSRSGDGREGSDKKIGRKEGIYIFNTCTK